MDVSYRLIYNMLAIGVLVMGKLIVIAVGVLSVARRRWCFIWAVVGPTLWS